jgi:hypothetical protein
MRIVVELPAGPIGLLEPGVFDRFSVEVTGEGSEEVLAALVGESKLGRMSPDGAHVVVSPDGLRTLAGGAVTPEWDAGFEGMCAYAAAKGWVESDGGILAHIERNGGAG